MPPAALSDSSLPKDPDKKKSKALTNTNCRVLNNVDPKHTNTRDRKQTHNFKYSDIYTQTTMHELTDALAHRVKSHLLQD